VPGWLKSALSPQSRPREAKTSPESTRTSKKLPDKGSISRPKQEMDDSKKDRLASLSDFDVLEELTWISSELRKEGN